jgi:hypothetical protein
MPLGCFNIITLYPKLIKTYPFLNTILTLTTSVKYLKIRIVSTLKSLMRQNAFKMFQIIYNQLKVSSTFHFLKHFTLPHYSIKSKIPQTKIVSA